MNHVIYPINVMVNNGGKYITKFSTRTKQGTSAQLEMMGVRLHITIDSAGYWSFKMGRKALKTMDYGNLANFPGE